MKSDKPYSIRCMDAISGLVGGRRKLAEKLGLKLVTLDHWVSKRRINPNYVMPIVMLSEGKFSAEELLGKFDSVDDENELND